MFEYPYPQVTDDGLPEPVGAINESIAGERLDDEQNRYDHGPVGQAADVADQDIVVNHQLYQRWLGNT
jgi:hypothetical protein